MKEDGVAHLRRIARTYVEKGLGKGSFDIILYAKIFPFGHYSVREHQ